MQIYLVIHKHEQHGGRPDSYLKRGFMVKWVKHLLIPLASACRIDMRKSCLKGKKKSSIALNRNDYYFECPSIIVPSRMRV